MGVMKMQKYHREDLLKALETVSPALSNTPISPIFTCLGFTGKKVFAYDHVIAINTDLETEFEGAVEGEVLIGLLKNWQDTYVELNAENDVLVVKAGRSEVKLSIRKLEAYDYKFPDPKRDTTWVDDQAFFIAVECCMRSVGTDPSIPDQTGVTLISNGKSLDVYSTDHATISWVNLKLNRSIKIKGDRVILPAVFCKEMLKLKSDSPVLELGENEAVYTDGTNIVHSKYVQTTKPMDFNGIKDFHLKGTNEEDLVPFPDDLDRALDNAIIITQKVVHKSMAVSIKKPGRLHLHSATKDQTELSEWVDISKDHRPLNGSVNIEPVLIKKGSNFFNKWLITESAVVMRKGDMVYLIGTTGS
jgi:DNA polymerase III sliding clamp (beta) subunit (PCNA family)